MVIGNTAGSIIAFVWAKAYIARLNGEDTSKELPSVTV
jgi:uncharacterized membrane protein YdjX (TVP38/TMEM64 family)